MANCNLRINPQFMCVHCANFDTYTLPNTMLINSLKTQTTVHL